MILYFSGTGNSRYTARRLSSLLNDELFSLNDALKKRTLGRLTVKDRLVIVTPTYAWRLPRIVRDWIEESSFSGVRDTYFVMTCGDSIHNAGYYNRKLSKKKGFVYRGTVKLIMPENYIAMFNSPTPEKAERIVDRADGYIEKIASVIREKGSFSDKNVTLVDRIMSGPVNFLFYPIFVKASSFRAGEKCTACGRCASLCPLGNIILKDGHPVWKSKCTHCMACISYCPVEAIEYGKKSEKKVRYTIEKVRGKGEKV